MKSETKMDKIIIFILNLLDPTASIDASVRLRILQDDHRLTSTLATVNFIIWPTLFILFYYTNDQHKIPLSTWRNYRFGLAIALIVTAFFAYFFRKNIKIIKIALIFSALQIGGAVTWSMHWGYPIQLKWPIWLPAIVIASATRSALVQGFTLLGLYYFTKYFGHSTSPAAWMTSDLAIAYVFLGFIHFMRTVWTKSKESEYKLLDLRKELDEQRMLYVRQVRTLISPVLTQHIDSVLSEGKNLVYALDEILKRKWRSIAVVYTDIRNFSERSSKIEFVEHELIPSSSYILDVCEDFGGVAKQIGDAIIAYYSLPDPEESLLRSVVSAFDGIKFESNRMKQLQRTSLERHFTVTFGEAYVGNMASNRHRDPTAIGDPPNLANRIDGLTKEPKFMEKYQGQPFILMNRAAGDLFKTFAASWNIELVDLRTFDITIKSYNHEHYVYILYVDKHNCDQLDRILKINGIERNYLKREAS